MKPRRILVLVHTDLIPPDSMDGYSDSEIVQWKTEFDVVTTLRQMGHEVSVAGVKDDLTLVRNAILEFEPDITFNLLEEFHGNSLYDHHVAGYLELMQQAYTGCNPRGLLLAHDKALSKKILSFHRIHVPRFAVIERNHRIRVPKRLAYPLIVKSLYEEGSYGIAQASVVKTEEKLVERVTYLHEKLETPAIVEEFIDGREMYVSILGNRRLQVLPVLELKFGNVPDGTPLIATSKVKWDWKYQERRQIDLEAPTDLTEALQRRILAVAKRTYRNLNLSGYARIDMRITADGDVYVLEANANPDIGYGEETAMAAEIAGTSYEQLLQKLLNLGVAYHAKPLVT